MRPFGLISVLALSLLSACAKNEAPAPRDDSGAHGPLQSTARDRAANTNQM